MDKNTNYSAASPIEVGTISEIHARLKAEGYRVALTGLRAWVKHGVIPAAYSGVRAYISSATVLKVLQGGTDTPPPENNGGIRKIA